MTKKKIDIKKTLPKVLMIVLVALYLSYLQADPVSTL